MSRGPTPIHVGANSANVRGARRPTPPKLGLASALPLIEACGPHGSLKAARRALSPATLRERDKNGATALMVAARHGRSDIVSLLLRWISPEAVDNERQTALIHASKAPKWNEGTRRCLERLLVVADPTQRDAQGRTALDHAAIAGNVDGMRFLWSLLRDQSDPLRWAATHECVAAVQFLAPICALDGSLDHEGPTALAAAAKTGNIHTLDALMAACGPERLARQATQAFEAAREGWLFAGNRDIFYSELFRYFRTGNHSTLKTRAIFMPVFAALAPFASIKSIESLIEKCSDLESQGQACPELRACLEGALIQHAMKAASPMAHDSSAPLKKAASPSRRV